MTTTGKIMIKLSKCDTGSICLNIISANKNGRHNFYILHDEWQGLYEKYLEKRLSSAIFRDIYSYCEMIVNSELTYFKVTWLSSDGYEVKGFQESFSICTNDLWVFIQDDGTNVKTFLPVKEQPASIIFKHSKNLTAVAENKLIRRKLVKFLRDNLNYSDLSPCTIYIYDDSIAYSFYFTVYRDGNYCYNGGIILHGQNDPDIRKWNYSIHT